MGNKYFPTPKDQQAADRFRRQQQQRSIVPKPGAPKQPAGKPSATKPGSKAKAP